jgi:hypothetical protein
MFSRGGPALQRHRFCGSRCCVRRISRSRMMIGHWNKGGINLSFIAY